MPGFPLKYRPFRGPASWTVVGIHHKASKNDVKRLIMMLTLMRIGMSIPLELVPGKSGTGQVAGRNFAATGVRRRRRGEWEEFRERCQWLRA